MIRGYWNGPDDKLADQDGNYYEGVNTLRAYRQGLISQEQYFQLLQLAKEKLLQEAPSRALEARSCHKMTKPPCRKR